MWFGRQEWEPDEIITLHRLYIDPTQSHKEIVRALPGRSWKAIVCRAQKEGLRRPNPNHHHINRDYFAHVDTFYKAYDLGLLAADGTVQDTGAISLYLQRRDCALVTSVRDRLAPDAPIYEYKNSCGFKIGCREMANDLAAYNVTPRKSLTLRWPEYLCEQMIAPFLLGYFDGDGSLQIGPSLSTTRWSMFGTQSFLVQARVNLERQVGVILSEPRPAGRRTPELFALRAYGQKAYALDRYLNQDARGLSRKHFPAANNASYQST